MKNDRELMQQAFDAFKSGRAADRAEVMTALRAALVTPPRREWLSLTDDESLEAAGIDGADEWFWKVVEGIEAKLKEKNHD
jgi:hypothetical protein